MVVACSRNRRDTEGCRVSLLDLEEREGMEDSKGSHLSRRGWLEGMECSSKG